MPIRAEIRFRAKTNVTSLSGDIDSDRPKNNITKFSLHVIHMFYGFTVKINSLKYKRFKDGRYTYKITA